MVADQRLDCVTVEIKRGAVLPRWALITGTSQYMPTLRLPIRRKPLSRSSSWSPAGCRPSRIASTMSGASSVSRSTRLAHEAAILSFVASSSTVL